MRWAMMGLLLFTVALGGAYAYYRDPSMGIEEAHHTLGFFMGQRLAATMCDQLTGGVELQELDRSITNKFRRKISRAEVLRRTEYEQLYGSQAESELRKFIQGEEDYFLQRTAVSLVFCHHYARELRIRQKAGWEYIEAKWHR